MDEKAVNAKVAIVGVGMVGTPLARYFEEVLGFKRKKNLFLHDKNPDKGMSDDYNLADVIFLTVPTPPDPKNGRACDLSIVTSVVKTIAPGKIAVVKSTVPPGTTEMLQKLRPDIQMLFNPEFLSEGRAWEDMVRPDRQIVGFTDQSLDAAHLVLSLLPKAPFMSPWGINTYKPTRITATEAEFIKYAGNVYFVRKVNWANALAKAAERLNVDYENIRKGMAADYRIGDSHLDVSHGGYRGWGGYCFPKDLDAFTGFAKAAGLDTVEALLKADRDFNEQLLKEQGLTIEDVSIHSNALDEKIKQMKNGKHA